MGGGQVEDDRSLAVRATRATRASPATREVRILSYDITYDACSSHVDSLKRMFSPAEHGRLFCLISDDPSAAKRQIEALLERAPDSPILLNWLGRCHSLLGEHEQADALARRNFEKNPDYLFARVNYAQVVLRHGEVDQIPIIFDGKFDLKLLYPQRHEFHVSEFLAFASVMCEYYVRIGETDAAETMLETMEQIEPDHEITCRMRDVLDTSLLLKAFRNVLGMRGRKRLRR
jgi:tetratricopeptide (TPR) repeat protein